MTRKHRGGGAGTRFRLICNIHSQTTGFSALTYELLYMVLYILHSLHYIQFITDKELNLAVNILRLQTSKLQFRGDYFHTDTGRFVGTGSVNVPRSEREHVCSYQAAGSTCGISPSCRLLDSHTASGGASHTQTEHRPGTKQNKILL